MQTQRQAGRRYLVFETSSLLSLLINFTSPYRDSCEALEALLRPLPGTGEAPVDEVKIPDHVFYELTGILPLSFPRMKAVFAEHADDPVALKKDIDFYVATSPRGSGDPQQGVFIKDQLRALIRFVAYHPDALVETETAKRYGKRLKAEYASLGRVVDLPKTDYQPNFGDAMEALGDAFDVDSLRIHAGQLFMMGFFREDEYNKRMGRDEALLASQQRFVKSKDFADILQARGWIDPGQSERIKSAADAWKKEKVRQAGSEQEKDKLGNDASYLTVGFLRKFPELMLLYRVNGIRNRDINMERAIAPRDELIDRALMPSKLLMEHYIFGNIMPRSAIRDIAELLGYDMSKLNRHSPTSLVSYTLYEQGFFERQVTVEDLKKIHQHLQEKGYDADKLTNLGHFIAALPQATKHQQRWFDASCSYKDDEQVHMGIRGTPYEKLFAQAIVFGGIDVMELRKLVQQSGGLPVRQQGMVGSNNSDILVQWGSETDGSDTTIWVSQDGFDSRQGHTPMKQHYDQAGVVLPLRHGSHHYWQFSAKELIDICRHNRSYPGPKDPVHRVFDALFYSSFTGQSASRLHDIAGQVLGEDRLIQLEKDFSNRNVRYWRELVPAYAESLSSLHVNSRIARKNMGEIATAEVATKLAASGSANEVWLVNHDSDLYPDAQGVLRFSESLKRMHSDKQDYLLPTEKGLEVHNGRLHFVRTDQFLDTVSALMQRKKPDMYDGLRMKKHMRDHESGLWETRIHQPTLRYGTAANHR